MRILVLLQVGPRQLGANLWAIIGGLVILALLAVVVIVIWTGIKVWWSIALQRRSMEEYQRTSRRADGRMYPPAMEGACDECGRRFGTIYHPDDGPRLCPDCYEPHWRRAEGWTQDS